MRPEDVKPKHYTNIDIIYNNGDFAIAYATHKDNYKQLVMRWNGTSDKPLGYPSIGKNPLWMRIDNKLSIPFLKSLIGQDGAKNDKINNILKDL